jgi:G3E family GTPase
MDIALKKSSDCSVRVPVHILTGFLGSGKTTVLQAALTDAAERTAVIVNDLVDIGLDQSLGADNPADLIFLGQGCVCCTAQNDMVDALHRLARASMEFASLRHVLVEIAGLADPSPVVSAILSDPRLNRMFFLGSVLTLVDSTHALEQIEHYLEAQAQIAAGDYLLISKADICDGETLAVVQARLHELNPMAPQMILRHGRIAGSPSNSAEGSLFALRPTILTRRHGGRAQQHTAGMEAHVIEIIEPVDWLRFTDWLQAFCLARGRDLLRMKGVVFTKERSTPIALHAVHFTIYPPEEIRNPAACAAKISRLAFIGRSLDVTTLRRTLHFAVG